MASVTFDSLSPIFAVENLDEALRFYQDVLGFSVAWSWGSPAELAGVCRDGVQITLAARPDAKPGGTSKIYLQVSGIDQFHDHIQRSAGRVTVPIADRAYGMRDFRVVDPSGNELDIGQPIAHETGA